MSGDNKTVLQRLLFSAMHNLKSISVNEYDTWFYDLAESITNNMTKLSFGHAQKLINILMKYHFVYFYSGRDDVWKTQYMWLEPYFNYLHSPIDRKVLTNLTNKYAMDIPPNKISWTKWEWIDKTLYEAIQQWIQERIKARAYSPHQTYRKRRLFYPSLVFVDQLWITSVCCVSWSCTDQAVTHTFLNSTNDVSWFHDRNVVSHSIGNDVHVMCND